MTKLAKYRPQAWFGWVVLIIGTGLLSTVDAETSLAHSIGYSALISIGGGTVYAITYFPVLAPLQVSQNALVTLTFGARNNLNLQLYFLAMLLLSLHSVAPLPG